MAFEHGRDAVVVRGRRFHAEIRLHAPLSAQVRIDASARPWLPGIAENIMRVMVAYRALLNGGVLLHSACFEHRDRAFLLFGHSGAGKSTCSRFAAQSGRRVLSDDMNVLVRDADGWFVDQVPFAGDVQHLDCLQRRVPLGFIGHLRQARRNCIETLSPATGVALLCASAAFVNEDPWRLDTLLDTCSRLLQYRPVQALYFRREAGFLDLLTEHHDAKAVA